MAALTPEEVRLCDCTALADGGAGLRFLVRYRGERLPAFAIRYRGRVFGYLNRCAHRASELDWDPGSFFSADGRWLVCATHGAHYAPDTGLCTAGPCRGGSLVPLALRERDSSVWLTATDELHLIAD